MAPLKVAWSAVSSAGLMAVKRVASMAASKVDCLVDRLVECSVVSSVGWTAGRMV